MQEFLLANDKLITWGLFILLFFVFGVPFWWGRRKIQRHTEVQDIRAEKLGLKEPVSLYPKVDPDICIGSAGCIAACPEVDVLGLRNGQAIAVNKAHCVGHGACERSCPVDAITLVFGSATRGVEIPRIKKNFETNVPGVFIVGELGGMGLIKNAFEQGKQCLEYLLKDYYPITDKNNQVYDLVIVGAGPGGISASIEAKKHGLNFVTLEREDIGGTVRYYPRKKLVLTRPFSIPNYGKLNRTEIFKEELVDLWDELVKNNKLESHIRTHQNVEKIIKSGDTFDVILANETIKANKVILAIGRRGTPRKLGIPGENLPNVAYNLKEPEHYTDDLITVVGGGDSAIEAAIALSDQPNNLVRLSYRKNTFARLKEKNREKLEQAVREERIELLLETEVVSNNLNNLQVKYSNGELRTYKNNQLFIFIGGILPNQFLNDIGIQMDVKFGQPLGGY